MISFQLDIVTPERTAYSDTITALSVPTPNGTIGVLPKHVGLFTVLGEGEIKISTGSKDLYLAIGGGFMEVTREKVSILVSRAVHADELNEKAILDAQKAAKEIITSRVSAEERASAQATLRRSILEMKVMRRHRSPHASPFGTH